MCQTLVIISFVVGVISGLIIMTACYELYDVFRDTN